MIVCPIAHSSNYIVEGVILVADAELQSRIDSALTVDETGIASR
jgi:hypothetical protein